jgi:hypothetical protein
VHFAVGDQCIVLRAVRGSRLPCLFFEFAFEVVVEIFNLFQIHGW